MRTKIPTAQDGWQTGDTEAIKKKAKEDMATILERTRHQIGKPEIAHVAPMPTFPSQDQWQ
jgi:hypothetical protein